MRNARVNYGYNRDDQRYNISDSLFIEKPSIFSALINSFFIVIQLTFVISFFIIMIYFIKQNIILNIQSSQIQSIVAIILWLMSLVFVMSIISKQLISLCLSGSLFAILYSLSALPAIQLAINILQLNSNSIDNISLVVLVLIINIIVVFSMILTMTQLKISALALRLLFIILIIFCVLVALSNMIIF